MRCEVFVFTFSFSLFHYCFLLFSSLGSRDYVNSGRCVRWNCDGVDDFSGRHLR